ncbi:hypothetical protein SUGI_0709160 [Cryptomeria japonica]|nr:hypothetical protein SUGI_0709160 [Cryptomeria japonica]
MISSVVANDKNKRKVFDISEVSPVEKVKGFALKNNSFSDVVTKHQLVKPGSSLKQYRLARVDQPPPPLQNSLVRLSFKPP